ncbi:MAG: hypothetical protein GYB68_13145 [Chloroflexi bacterium]|nr:hypothetical protein [Chloroflexota bacterium]
MNYSVRRLPDEKIIVVVLMNRYDFEKNSKELYDEIDKLMGADETELYCITDLSTLDIDFSDVVVALGSSKRGGPGSPADPRFAQNIFIGTDDMVQFAAQSMQQTQYGKLDTLVFPSLEEALLYARARLS